MTQYCIGAGGWAYFQVPGLSPLEAYSTAFDFVEVNTTFYSVPSLRQVRSWRRRVPSHFEFTVRCHRTVTHQHQFQVTPETREVFRQMIRICQVLRASVLHLQTSPTFLLSSRNIQRLRKFFTVADFDGVNVPKGKAYDMGAFEYSKPETVKGLRLIKKINILTDLE